ncbi:MFS general substrate transporter, partial [Thozetella sp. PMI_491]
RAERRLKWKIDLVILPLLSTIYFLSQMGRSDLGNAQTAGMGKDLGLSANQYSNAASMFVVGYIIFQLPGTILIRKVGANIQFGLACMGWGLVTACAVTLQNYGGLLATRVLVGCFEAFTQGTVFYLSFWYTHDELATRAAIFYSATALAGSFNGLIAYAVQVTLDGVNHWASWRWIFFVEGIVPIGWAFLVMLMLPKSPETAPAAMFSQKEKVMIIKRSRAAQNTGESKIEMKAIFRLLVDPLFWMLAILNSAQHFCVATISNFLPAILTGFGWSSTKSQLMTVIVYACAFVGILFWSRVSDKTRQRGLFVCINCAIATLGYALLLGLTDSTGRFIATCICAASVYPSVVLIVTWTMVNNPGYTQR